MMMMMGLSCYTDACMMMEIDERSPNYLVSGPPGSRKEPQKGRKRKGRKRDSVRVMRLYLDHEDYGNACFLFAAVLIFLILLPACSVFFSSWNFSSMLVCSDLILAYVFVSILLFFSISGYRILETL
jgi:hypothetical protein